MNPSSEKLDHQIHHHSLVTVQWSGAPIALLFQPDVNDVTLFQGSSALSAINGVVFKLIAVDKGFETDESLDGAKLLQKALGIGLMVIGGYFISS